MDRAKFYAYLRSKQSKAFGSSLGQNQVEMLELLLDEGQRRGTPLRQLSYILATAVHETGAFKYMREIWGPTAAQKRYEGRKDLGNTVAGDGKKFMGRGFVQITGRRNYTDWGKRLGLDLLKEPQLAERPDIAARILFDGMLLGTFTGKKLSDYIEGTKADYEGARRIVNGTDKKALIAGYAKSFEEALRQAGYLGIAPQPSPTTLYEAALKAQQEAAKNTPPLTNQNSTPAPTAVPAAATGFLAWLISLFTKKEA